MRKVIFTIAMSVLFVSCGGGQPSSTSKESADPASEKSTTTSQKKSNGDVLQRVEQIYQDVFSMYAEASENEGPITESPDEKYCSKSWNDLLEKVIEYDTTHHPDDIGFFEADYWVMGQDFDHPTVSNLKLVEQKGDRAVVDLDINNFEVIHVRLEMVNERGDWYIDTFIDLDNDLNWKKEMEDYLKES